MSGLVMVPPRTRLMYVMAHGAGAGMRHRFLEGMAQALASQSVATLRYQFPYMEAGRRSPDRPEVAQSTVRAAVAAAARVVPSVPMVAGGKSFGGRMTSQAAAALPIPGVRGVVFLGFPLHAPRRPSSTRAEHLSRVSVPLLFLQGTRDDLADLDLMRVVATDLAARATLHIVEGGDHSFKLPKSVGRTETDVLDELATAIVRWSERLS